MTKIHSANCQICDKSKFYSLASFCQAHKIKPYTPQPDIWIPHRQRLIKGEEVWSITEICKFCKEENHKKNCKFLSQKQIN